MLNKDHGMTEADNPSLFFMVAHGFIHIGYYYRPQSTHWNIHNSSTSIKFSLRGHSNGLTFLREGNLSRDGVNGEHLAGWNPGRLFQEAEAQLAVDRAAIIPIQSLHLHKRDPWDTGRGHKVDNQHRESKSHVAEVGGCDSSAYETFLYFYHHTSSSAQGSLTFEKPELNAASHALTNKSGHIVILVNDAHFYREALTARRRPERHLRSHTLLPWWWTSVGTIVVLWRMKRRHYLQWVWRLFLSVQRFQSIQKLSVHSEYALIVPRHRQLRVIGGQVIKLRWQKRNCSSWLCAAAYNLVRSAQQFWREGGLKAQGMAVCLCSC